MTFRTAAGAAAWIFCSFSALAAPPDHPQDAAGFRRLQQASDDGLVRPDGRANALRERQLMMQARPKVGGISADTWTALGPDNIGGRIRSILTHPTDPNWLMVGSVTGGLWKSIDAGASWHLVDDLMPTINIESLARDPNHVSRLYAGTGECPMNFRGLGIFVSNDGGVTWNPLAGTNPNDAGKGDFVFIERIDVNRNNSDIVVVATCGGGVWRTMNALSPSPTWQKIYDRGAMSVKFDPFLPNRLLIGETGGGSVGIIADVTTAGAAPNYTYSVSPLIPGAPSGRVEISPSRAVPGLVLASLDQSGGVVYVSTDHGATWAFNSRPAHLDQGWYANAIWTDPIDARRAIVGGNSLFRLDGPPNWWTTNTPLTVTQMSAATAGSAHPDQHAIMESLGYDASTNFTVYFTNDGGIYRRDITASAGGFWNVGWTELNNGLGVTQFYTGIAQVYPTGQTRIVGGTQDNGTLEAPTSGMSWIKLTFGDGGYVALDPIDPAITYYEDIYANLLRRRPGETFAGICSGPNPIAEASSSPVCKGTNETNFITPFTLDPGNRDTMLVGASSLWRSTNVRLGEPPDWFRIKPYSNGDYINAVRVANGHSDVIWVGHNSGMVFCTTNGTAAAPAWTRVLVPAARMVTSITLDPINPNRVFVTYGGFNGSNVWELSDPTQVCRPSPSMVDRHANLPRAPIYSIARHPRNADLLYVATEVGIFASADGGRSWSPTNDAASSVSARQLFWVDDTTLVAATFGRGMFKATVSPGTLQFAQATASVAETAGSIALNVTRSGGQAGVVAVSHATSDGSAMAGVNYGATQGTLSWSDGDGSVKTITVPILNDGVAAGNKTFAVVLSNATGGAMLGGAAAVTVTIVDASGATPGAPTIGTATAGDASIVVGFSPPASTGSSPITSYTATCSSAGNPSASATGTASPITVSGVAVGASYTCVVAATNSAGSGPASAASNPVVPGRALSLSSALLDFGGQSMNTTSPAMTITVTNTGGTTISISSIAVTSQFGQTSNCSSLAAGASCTITVTFSPAVVAGALNSTNAVGGTLTITSNAAGSPTTAALGGTAEKSLVTHYYRSILRRTPDPGGHDFWASEAARLAGLGANVNEVWFAMSMAFFASAEYGAFGRDNAGYLTDLYNTFFNRAPDTGGFNFWMNNMAEGMPREAVLVQFLFSPEFAGFTQEVFGNTQVRAEMDMTMDMYRGILERLPDSGGYTFFLGQFRQAQCTSADAVRAEAAQVSHDFFTSPEYGARNRTHAQFMAEIYNAIMRRGADLEGINFWIGELNSGRQTREQVRQQFVASPEFSDRVTNVINAGCQH